MSDARTGLVIALPSADLGGVTTWALRTREALGASRCAIVSAPDPASDIEGASQAYERAASALLAEECGRVLLAPQLSGACYAAACVAAHRIARHGYSGIGVIGWMHTVIRYDIELLRRFAPGLGAVVCVSQASSDALEGVIHADRRVVAHTGVRSSAQPVSSCEPSSALRLIYTGRLEQNQKRVMALPACAAQLRRRGVPCELTIVGDGPARPELERAARADASITIVGAAEPGELVRHLDHANLYLLPSRSEGLGLGRIEAALRARAPVVCAGSGGALEGVEDNVSGLVTPATPEMDEPEVGARMGERIAEAWGRLGAPGIAQLGDRARASAARLCDPITYAATLERVLDQPLDLDAHAPFWSRVAHDARTAADFTVPPDAPRRARRACERVGARGVLLYGGGTHTCAIWDALAEYGVEVLGVIDDDPARAGGSFRGAPVTRPEDAGRLGARDVLISSWLHQDEIWARRGVLEAQGLRVHRIYEDEPSPCGVTGG